MDSIYDAIVVGAGATGGWCVKVLTQRGLRVLLLDAGPLLGVAEARTLPQPHPDHERLRQRRPIQAASRLYQPTNGHLYIDDLENPYLTSDEAPFRWIRSQQVGGRTLLWSRVAPRMSDYELEEWPISHEELAPYYDRIEAYHGTLGVAEGLPQLPDGKYLGPPPVPAQFASIKSGVATCFPERRVTLIRRMIEDRTAGRYPEHSSVGSTIRDAERTRRLTLCPNSVVSRVLTNSAGRANGVVIAGADGPREIRSRVVVLAASTLNTLRIMLASASERQPNGLGNSTGLLGHYLVDHFVGPMGVGIGARLPDAKFEEDALFYVPRFRNLEKREAAFRGGYAFYGWMHPEPDSRIAMTLTTFGEVLPRRENRVTLDSNRTDRWRIPLLKIEYRYSENERLMAEDAHLAIREIFAAVGFQVMESTAQLAVPGTCSHELGGARMGSDPRSSVLDPLNQCWDVPGLFVVDGACFVTAGYQNPTLTMMAISARASEHIADALNQA
jgi:choline dehydrogenase-like flavoprotein